MRLHVGQFDPGAARWLSVPAASTFRIAEVPPPANARPHDRYWDRRNHLLIDNTKGVNMFM